MSPSPNVVRANSASTLTTGSTTQTMAHRIQTERPVRKDDFHRDTADVALRCVRICRNGYEDGPDHRQAHLLTNQNSNAVQKGGFSAGRPFFPKTPGRGSSSPLHTRETKRHTHVQTALRSRVHVQGVACHPSGMASATCASGIAIRAYSARLMRPLCKPRRASDS